MTKSASSASTRKTISASDIVASPSLLRLEPERQAVHPRHLAALPAAERTLAFVPRGPRRAAELRLADLARRQVVQQHGHLADEDVDARGGIVSRRHPAEQPPAERHEKPDRDEREEEPLDPSRPARSERCQHTDGDRAETEEEEEEAARRHDFAADQRKAEQHPQPPRHPWRHGATERKGCQIDGGSARHMLIRQRQPLVAYPLQLLQLRTGRVLRLDLANPPEPALELAVAELAAHLRLGDEPVDVVADLVERADVGIRREAVERRLEAEARLGVGEARQHAHAFLAQAENLGVEGDQVVLGTFGLACQLGEIGGQTVDLGGERIPTADQRDGGDVVIVLHGDVELAADAGELGRLGRELLSELAPHVEDTGGGMAELLVLDDALADRRLVDGVRMAMLALAHPVGEGTAEKARQSRDDVHGALPQVESLVASSALMPSSRIFCWRFWRCMPMSSAAFVMFPP